MREVVIDPDSLKEVLPEPDRMRLENTVLVDDCCLVFVYHVNYSFHRTAPRKLVKYSKKQYAPHSYENLQVSTLRYYRENHQDYEGSGDPFEGTVEMSSSHTEFCTRHGVPSIPGGCQVATTVTYKTEDTSFIYCMSVIGGKIYCKYDSASVISDVSQFATQLGVEFARRIGERSCATTSWHNVLPELARVKSGCDKIAHVYHGLVVYDDEPGERIFSEFDELSRGTATAFFKRREFKKQKEYRFVLSLVGKSPTQQTTYLQITPELRSLFQDAGDGRHSV